MKLRHLIFIILLSGAFLLLSIRKPAVAVTPPPEGDNTVILKPSRWRIYTPWRSDIESNTYGNSYGVHTHVGVHYYALDFNPLTQGQEIYAIAPGRVVYAKKGPSSWGNTVVIEHHDSNMIGDDGYYYSQYSHLAQDYVNVDDVIGPNPQNSTGGCNNKNKGFDCPIGQEGNSGDSSFLTHLHFELHRCETRIEPFNDSHLEYPGCQKVIPEPMIGAQVYELWYYFYNNNPANRTPPDKKTKYNPIAWRPANYNGDTVSPTGYWGTDVSSGDIQRDQKVIWDIHFSDNSNRIKEVRATIYFANWPGTNPRITPKQRLDPSKIWFVAAACNPLKDEQCRNGHWRFEWDPWADPTRDDSMVPIDWLPSKTRSITQTENACISFDIFDEYGNVRYAPGGVEGSACAQLFNSSANNLENLSIDENSPYRLIRLIPQSNVSSDGAALISQTLADYTIVSAGQTAQQTWRIRNTGSSTWGNGYKLVFREGDPMNSPRSVTLPPAAPGETVEITIPFQTPSQERAYASRWQLQNPQGTYFGPNLWIKVKVVNNLLTEHITLFDISPPSPSEATTVHIVGRVRYFQDYRSMRFRIGDQVFEQPNIQQIGEQLEISMDWQTASLQRGTYAIVFEVAKKGDNDWANPERVVKTYTLIGTPAPINRPPDRPLLKSPYNWFLKDSSGSPASVELCVHPVTDPDGNSVKYYFEVKDQGGGVYASSGWVDSPCWTRTYNPNTYSWRVKAGDGSAESDWSSDTWNFTVAKGGVYIGSYQIFEPNTNETHLCVFVNYDGIQGPEVYAWLNKAPDGSENGEWRLLDHYGPNAPPDCTQPNYHGFWIHSPEYETGTHKLRISAVKRDSGANAKIDTTYTVGYIRPSDVKLLAPSTRSNNGTWWNQRTIHFEWSPSIRAEWYTLRVSTNSNPWNDPAPIVDQTFPPGVTSFDYTFSRDYPKLYWSVRAGNSAGATDSGPDVWFGIDTVLPTCQVQSLPSSTYENVFQVNWNGGDDSSGVRAYDIQYRDTSRSEWLDWLSNTPITKPYELFSGLPGHVYEFRCRAIDRAGNIGLYPTQPDTSIKIDPASRPQSAWWDSSYQYKRNLIIQNNMTTLELPAGYPVHLHFDSSTTPTAAEIYNASLSNPKCNDLRIVFNNTSELDRIVDKCQQDQIDIWFRTQTPVQASGIDNHSYSLYFGNSNAVSPPSSRNKVFYPVIDSNHLRVFDMREGSGFIIYDAVGNGNATMSSELSWTTTGKFGPAILSPGDVDPEPRPGIDAGIGPQPSCSMSVELWVKRLEGHSYSGILAHQEGGWSNPGRWVFMIDNRKLNFTVYDVGRALSNRNIDESTFFNSWHHFAATYDCSGVIRLYIDGELDNTVYLDKGGMNPATVPLKLLSTPYQSVRLAGEVSHFAISNIARTDFSYGKFAKITFEPDVLAGGVLIPPTAGSADLAVLDLKAFQQTNGTLLFQALVKNIGSKETLNGFFTDLYADHLPNGTGDYTGSIKFWINDPIAAGQTVTLTAVVDDLMSVTGLNASMLTAGSEITTTIYAQADSTGAVPEEMKLNNIYSNGVQLCTAMADEYEEDNTAASAQLWDLNGVQQHNFHQAGDQDWVQFSAEAGKTYIFRSTHLGPQVDTTMYLYAQDKQTLLAYSDDEDGTRASRIVWTAPANGVYYLMVKDWNFYTDGCGTGYGLMAARYQVYLPLILRQFLP